MEINHRFVLKNAVLSDIGGYGCDYQWSRKLATMFSMSDPP